MRQQAISLFLCYLLLYACGGVEAGRKRNSEEDSGSGLWTALTYVAVGGGILAMGLPALGFTATGIAANSWAASMMSWSAVANGGAVPAGGVVATLQSLGATGGSSLLAKIGGALGYVAYKHQEDKKVREEDD